MRKRLYSYLSLLVILVGFTGCSMESSYGEQLTKALSASRQARKDLLAIDPLVREKLYIVTSDLKEAMKKRNKGDTLSIELGVALDAILVSNQRLHGLNVDRRNCYAANKKLEKRLTALLADIQSGAGNRASYFKYVSKELKETEKISKHAAVLRQRYDAAKQAIAQFKPVLDRFISEVKPIN